jgi:hypothetical protein
MTFPTVNEPNCPTDIPSDSGLVLKPELVTACAGELQFSTFLKTAAGGEALISIGLTYASLSPSVLTIDAATGLATLIATGVATVTVTNGTLMATAQVEVMGTGTHCCDEVVVATEVMIDNSKSMKNLMPFWAGTRLDWARWQALAFMGVMRLDKDVVGLMRFNYAASEEQAISHALPSVATVNGIPQSNWGTDFEEMLISGIARLNVETADLRVLVVFSDGENRTTMPLSPTTLDDIRDIAEAFKDAGGIIICVGAAAGGDGFALLQMIASGGFFLNARDPSSTNSVQNNLRGMLCFYCGGYPVSYGYCLSEPIPAQVPATVLPQLEL